LVEASEMGHDQLFKAILHGLLREFFELFFPELAAKLDFDTAQFSDKELFKGFPDGERREPDVVALVQTWEGEREVVVVHVEVQTEQKGDFRRRMFEYYALLWLHFETPVFPIALILRGGPHRGTATVAYRQEVFGREVVRFRYASVALARLSGWEYLEKGPLAAGLAALMQRRQAPVDLDLRAGLMHRVLTSGLDESLKFQLANLIETYFTLTDEERGRYRRLISREEYREVQDVETTYFDRLRQEGREEGREAGRIQGKREALKRLLVAKFGPLSPAIEARIEAIDSAEELDRHFDRALAADSLEEMSFGP
jgi:hypothetical protein